MPVMYHCSRCDKAERPQAADDVIGGLTNAIKLPPSWGSLSLRQTPASPNQIEKNDTADLCSACVATVRELLTDKPSMARVAS